HLEADVLDQVVVERATELYGTHDGGKVVVGQDHDRRFFRHISTGDAHGDTDIRFLQRWGVIDAVAGHGCDVAGAFEDIDETHFVLRSHARDNADVVDLCGGLFVSHGAEFGACDGAPRNTELTRDRCRGN